MKKKGRRTVTVLLALALGGCGFTGNLRLDPGFASFRTPATLRETDREFALSLGPVPIRLATMISRPLLEEDEPWIPEALESVRAVRVYTYRIDGDAGNVERHMDTTRNRLVDDGWHPVSAVREDGGLAAALVRWRDRGAATVRGVAVIAQDEDELVLVNVIGDIRPESFNAVMEGLDIEVPFVHFAEIQSARAAGAASRSRLPSPATK